MILVQIWCKTLLNDIARNHTTIKRSESISSIVSERVRLGCEHFAKAKQSAYHRLGGEALNEYNYTIHDIK